MPWKEEEGIHEDMGRNMKGLKDLYGWVRGAAHGSYLPDGFTRIFTIFSSVLICTIYTIVKDENNL